MDTDVFGPQEWAGRSEKEIAEYIRAEGFDPVRIVDPAGYVYPEHDHPATKLLAILAGEISVTVEGATYRCGPGDRIAIPGNVRHSAVVGPTGCAFFWSEKLL